MKTNAHLFLMIIELKKSKRWASSMHSWYIISWVKRKKTQYKTHSGKKDQVQRWQESSRRDPSCMMSQNIPSPHNAEQGIKFPMPVLGEYFQGTVLSSLCKGTKHLYKQSGGQAWIKIMCSSKFCSSALQFGKVILVTYTPTQALLLFFPAPPLCCGSSVHALCM